MLAELFQPRQVVIKLALGIGQKSIETGLEFIGTRLGEEPGAAIPDLRVGVGGGRLDECGSSQSPHLGELGVGFLTILVDLAAEPLDEFAGP